MTDFIIEIANTHGGSEAYLTDLIDEFEGFEGHGMKFQAFHPDGIACPDFPWYEVYKDLFFDEQTWAQLLKRAAKTKLIWLDIFDFYGVKILSENRDLIYGLKLQASVLYNVEVIQYLKRVDCSSLKLVLNISGLYEHDIQERVAFFENELNFEEILVEVGFQAYPTKFEHSGLHKIQRIKNLTGKRIVFADHCDGNSGDSLTLPAIAVALGADLVEKHVMHSKHETKYDHYSSINCEKYAEFTSLIERYAIAQSSEFLNAEETNYLQNSKQIPILNTDIQQGEILDVNRDLIFRRSSKKGLDFKEIHARLTNFNIFNRDVKIGEVILNEYFKQATIVTIIACRMKSTRLKQKAILKINALTSVEKCIQSCLRINHSNATILATSLEEEDAILENYTYQDSVLFHKGSPEDVIERYIEAADLVKADIIIRVTADMPFVSKEITETLLIKHFESGADFTCVASCAVGTAPEIINLSALKRVKSFFPKADYSEYMSWYFKNNTDYFKVNEVELPSEMQRDYRLTLDYQEDLDLMIAIDNYLTENHLEPELKNIFNYLDENPEIAQLNAHLSLKYKTDEALISLLNELTKIK